MISICICKYDLYICGHEYVGSYDDIQYILDSNDIYDIYDGIDSHDRHEL